MASKKLPTRVGRYEIRKELGRGMMGVVYEAYDPSLHRTIALKVIHLALAGSPREQETFERRFLAEARIAARLSHPGIVVVHDVGRDEKTGTLYIALERLEGETLAERSSAGQRMEWREALRIVARVAEALHYAHAQGVVHRDIKPANIMVLPSGETKILDFGLAKHLTGHDLTQTGQFVGTPLFMAPEQVLGQPVDGRTDLFSLGSVLYTLLSGKRAFAADNVPRIMARVAHHEPPPPTTIAPGLPPAVDYLVARALAKSPGDRYASGQALTEDADDIRAGREPRHRAGWTLPVRGEGTMVSARAEGSGLVDLGLEPIAPRDAGRRARGRPLRTLTLGMLMIGTTVLYMSFFWPERFAELLRSRTPPPASAPAPLLSLQAAAPESGAPSPAAVAAGAPQAAPSPEPSAPPGPGPETAPSPEPAAAETAVPASPDPSPPTPSPSPAPSIPAGPSPTPEASPAPTARPTPSPAPKKSPPPAPAPGQLAIHMEHHLKSGTVRVFLDGKLVVEDTLDSKVTRKILFFAIRRGVFQETLKVSPGRHEISVRVKWEDREKAQRIPGTFRPGVTRRLQVSVSRLGGDLSLEWKP